MTSVDVTVATWHQAKTLFQFAGNATPHEFPSILYSSAARNVVCCQWMELEQARPIDSSVRDSYRPRVSRETRRLLITAALAVLTLSVLARFRFPDRPVTPNPVPLLTQLTSPSRFSDLATTIGDVRTRLSPWLVALVPTDIARAAGRPSERVAALRIRSDLAVAILPPDMRSDQRDPLGVIAEDPTTGLAVVNVRAENALTPPAIWTPDDLDAPRYVVATSPSRTGVSLRPSFAG
jgi:hypothetical protein